MVNKLVLYLKPKLRMFLGSETIRLRAIILILFLAIQFSQPAASLTGNNNELLPITWSKNLDSGFISTAPLIADGTILFKTPKGINALNVEGDELWDIKQDSYYELSPLIHLQRENSTGCNNDNSNNTGWPDLVITGWTNGQVSAHRLIDGGLHWSWNSEIIKNGITGRIIVENTSNGWQVIVPTESGVAGLCPIDGNLIWSKNFTDGNIGYRHSPTLFIKENTEWVVVGNEKGQMLEVSLSDSNTSITIDLEYGLENPKIRGPIIFINSEIDRRLIPIQGDNGSLFVEWSSNTTVIKLHQLNGTIGLLANYAEIVVVPTSTNTTVFDCKNSCLPIGTLTNESVTGEVIIHLNEYENISVILPHNINQGYWSIQELVFDGAAWKMSSKSALNWNPKVPQYVTAGIGVSEYLVAAGNDASYAEVIVLDLELGKSHFEIMRQSNQKWIEEHQQIETKEEIEIVKQKQNELNWSNAFYFILVVIFIGIIAKLLSTIKSDDLRWPALILLVALILIVPGIIVNWTEFVNSNNSTNQDIILESEIPDEWRDLQTVIIEFPNYELNGTEIRYNENGEEIERGFSSNNKTNRIMVGGLSNSQNVWEATLLATNLSGLELEYTDTSLGVFITSINGMENSGLNGWVYTINTRYGTQSVDVASIDSNSTVIWQYK